MPILRRLAWHLRRVRRRIDRRAVVWFVASLAALMGLCAAIVMLLEGPTTFQKWGESFYWVLTILLGSGDASFVASVGGRLVSSFLIFMSLTMVALLTGVLLSFIIDVVLREGQGMGTAGFRGHIVLCGWNATAGQIIEELKADGLRRQVVVLCDRERSPAGGDVYFVRGNPAVAADLERAAIADAAAAIVFPEEPTSAADVRSILVTMAIESVAPDVRTIVEVTDPANIEHVRRAKADEVVSTSELGAHLLARSAAYAGVADLVVDLVSGGEGSELYRVPLPDDWAGRSVADASDTLRRQHGAVLLAIARGSERRVNPPAEMEIAGGDEALVLAEQLPRL